MKLLSYRNEKNAKFISTLFGKPLDKPDWFKVESVSDDEAEVLIYDFIGWPFNDSASFIRTLAEIKQSKITIRINSPGGDVWDANAIHNAIKSHPSKPTTRIESLAASAASYIAVAGHKKQAFKNAMVMIHEPMTGMYGNQFELRETADILEQISNQMIDMYADNTNVGKRELKDMLKAETWMTAKVAKEKGFIDSIIESGKGAKAEFDLSFFSNLPDEFRADSKKKSLTEREIERAIRDVFGLSENRAKTIISKCKKEDEVEADNSAELAEVIAVAKNFVSKMIL